MASIILDNVHKSFGSEEVIKGIELSIEEGEFCVFLGPSGCGKSTLLRLIAGLEQVGSGTISIGNHDVTQLPPKERDVAMVFQSYALYPHMTVFENMSFGLKLAKSPRTQIEQKVMVMATARTLHIEEMLSRKPSALSGGQRQRVAIGRAIVREPSVFLFDEPLSNLDADLRVQMRLEFTRLHRRLATTMIYVTHDQVEAMTLAQKMVVIEKGKIAQQGAPLDIYHRPRNLFVAGFIGSPRMNLIAGHLSAIEPHHAEVTLTDGTRIRVAVDAVQSKTGDPVTLGIRPEHIVLGTGDDNLLQGTITVTENLGDHSLAYIDGTADSEPVVARCDAGSPPSTGGKIQFSFPPERCHLFDSYGLAFLE